MAHSAVLTWLGLQAIIVHTRYIMRQHQHVSQMVVALVQTDIYVKQTHDFQR